jgi:hypothetical protein
VKHRIYAKPHRTPTPSLNLLWEWFVRCGICAAVEPMETWNQAIWYLDLHTRTSHDA